MYKNKLYFGLISFIIMFLGVLLLIILLNIDYKQASFNSTSMQNNIDSFDLFRNYIADILFQTFGLSSYLIPIILLAYSYQIFFHKKIEFLLLKIMLLLIVMVFSPALSCNIADKYSCGILGLFISQQFVFIDTFQMYILIGFSLIYLYILSFSIKDIIFFFKTIAFMLYTSYKIGKTALVSKGSYNHQNEKVIIKAVPNISYIKKMISKISLFSEQNKNIQEIETNETNTNDLEVNNNIYNNDYEIADNHYLDKEDFLSNSIFLKNYKAKTLNSTQEENNIKTNVIEDNIEDNLQNNIQNIENKENTNDHNDNVDNLILDLTKEKKVLEEKKKVIKNYNNYAIPLDFLSIVKSDYNIKPAEIKENAIKLEKIIEEFGINGKIVNIKTGPVVTLYEIIIPAGVKTSKLISLETDIALRMKAISVRIAIVPGKDVIGIELPNKNRKTVYLKEVLQSNDFINSTAKLPIALGYDINGKPVVVDLTAMPHLLIAGTTGSGKSVGVNGMILSLLYKLNPNKCKLIMIDPKMLELSVYQDIPHLITPVVTNPKQAISALKWVVKEMEYRYYQMSLLGVRNINGFNEKINDINFIEKIRRQTLLNQGIEVKFEYMPYIVVIIDEMADLMIVAGKEVESAVQRLAQMARASGIHLIMATQRPSVDVITGTIKANFPTRISFQVSSKIDSRTILGEQGSEQLLGRGDMLYMSGVGRIQRVHGPFIADEEVFNIVEYLKAMSPPSYIDNLNNALSNLEINDKGGDKDELFDEALDIIKEEGKASTSFLQRKFQIGYNRAARIMEQLEEAGIVSKASATGKRDILIK